MQTNRRNLEVIIDCTERPGVDDPLLVYVTRSGTTELNLHVVCEARAYGKRNDNVPDLLASWV